MAMHEVKFTIKQCKWYSRETLGFENFLETLNDSRGRKENLADATDYIKTTSRAQVRI